jgi:RNA polymerase sigma-70 factor, ECF subfamily
MTSTGSPRGRCCPTAMRPLTDARIEIRPPLARLRRDLLQQAIRVLPDPDDAEDACQEALVRTWRAVDEGRCLPKQYQSFGRAVLRNVLREMWRSARRHAAAWTPPDSLAPDPLSEVEQAETRADVQRAMASLPPQQREVASLSLLQGLSCAEVSRRLGMQAAAARQRKRRAVQRLRDALAARGRDNGRPAPAGAGLDGSRAQPADIRAAGGSNCR